MPIQKTYRVIMDDNTSDILVSVKRSKRYHLPNDAEKITLFQEDDQIELPMSNIEDLREVLDYFKKESRKRHKDVSE